MGDYTADDKYQHCFVCSPTNPYGLHLKNTFVNGRAHMEITPHENMQGLKGLMHGGFSLMLMDEIMYYAMESLKVDTVTLNSSCDFVSPAYIGHKMIAEGWVEKREGKKVYAAGELRDADTEKVIVKAKGLYYEMDMSSFLPN